MRILLLLAFLFSTTIALANKIDELKTEEEIARFVDTLSQFNSLTPRFHWPGSLQLKYLKIDIDKNGATDLLVNDSQIFAIMDIGKDQFDLKYIGSVYSERRLMGIDTTGQFPLLIVKKQNGRRNENGAQFPDAPDTITYKFDGFIEYNSNPPKLDLQFIKFYNISCSRRPCTGIDLVIGSDRQVKLLAKHYLKRDGQFQTTLDIKSFDELICLINYMNPDQMRYDYTIQATHQPTMEVEIRYNGRARYIMDYGLEGTLGLQRLYSLIDKLIEKEQWQKAP